MADQQLSGKRVAVLAAPGVEQVELTKPWEAIQNAGGQPSLVSLESGKVQAYNDDVEEADTFDVDVTVADADAGDYDALLLPGGTTNPDKLRMDPDAVAFVKAFFDAGKPVAAICHGPWSLVEADVVRGRTLTSFPSLQTDIRNAGGTWVDEELVTCTSAPSTLVTSRNPDDLDAFSQGAVDAFAGSSGQGA